MLGSGALTLLFTLPLAACWGSGGGQAETFEQTYLPYRQPNDDPAHPRMMAQMERGGGSTQPVRAELTLPTAQKDRLMWGRRYLIRGTTVSNPTWNTTSRVVEEIVSETVEIDARFQLRGLSAPWFGPDRRSFIDGKGFVCAAEELCGEVDVAIASGAEFDLSMRFGPTPEADLVVTGL